MIDINDAVWEFVNTLNDTYSSDSVALSRHDFLDLSNHNDKFIVIDVTNPLRTSEERYYNSDDEKEYLSTRYSADVRLDYYGNNTIHDVYRFANEIRSGAGVWLAKRLNISCSRVRNIQKIDFITDKEDYKERYFAQFKVHYNYIVEINTNRVDTLNIGVISE